MKRIRDVMPEYSRYYKPRYPGRPLEYVKDRAGNGWLCEKGVNRSGDLRAQGCWRCEEMAFPDGGR